MVDPIWGGVGVVRKRWVMEVVCGGGMPKEQGAVGVREEVSWWAGRQLFAGDRCVADKVYLTPTPGSTGHRGEGDPVHLQLKGWNFCHRKRSGGQWEKSLLDPREKCLLTQCTSSYLVLNRTTDLHSKWSSALHLCTCHCFIALFVYFSWLLFSFMLLCWIHEALLTLSTLQCHLKNPMPQARTPKWSIFLSFGKHTNRPIDIIL